MRYRSLSSILPWMVVRPASRKVSRVSWHSGYRPIRYLFAYRSFTFYARPSQAIQLSHFWFMLVLNPKDPKISGLGSSLFARRYWGNLVWLLFLWLLRCFSSPGLSSFRMPAHNSRRVAPFGDVWINAYLRLPKHFRSLSRPSSTLNAKASAVCPL